MALFCLRVLLSGLASGGDVSLFFSVNGLLSLLYVDAVGTNGGVNTFDYNTLLHHCLEWQIANKILIMNLDAQLLLPPPSSALYHQPLINITNWNDWNFSIIIKTCA